jgi:hypothetical protein
MGDSIWVSEVEPEDTADEILPIVMDKFDGKLSLADAT